MFRPQTLIGNTTKSKGYIEKGALMTERILVINAENECLMLNVTATKKATNTGT
ncbi:MAG: hypothetical protein JWR72_2909 [Flavisolibacter sp.]|jgi:hypothetical protein|nr:hypothetical protein [Flavisolibacter sp.]